MRSARPPAPSDDSWGDVTRLGNQDMTYDSSGRHVGTFAPNVTAPTTSDTYTRDATDNISSNFDGGPVFSEPQ